MCIGKDIKENGLDIWLNVINKYFLKKALQELDTQDTMVIVSNTIWLPFRNLGRHPNFSDQ